MQDLNDHRIYEGWINIVAFVADNATALTMASEKLVQIMPETPEYRVTDLLNNRAFVPGLNYSTTASTHIYNNKHYFAKEV